MASRLEFTNLYTNSLWAAHSDGVGTPCRVVDLRLLSLYTATALLVLADEYFPWAPVDLSHRAYASLCTSHLLQPVMGNGIVSPGLSSQSSHKSPSPVPLSAISPSLTLPSLHRQGHALSTFWVKSHLSVTPKRPRKKQLTSALTHRGDSAIAPFPYLPFRTLSAYKANANLSVLAQV